MRFPRGVLVLDVETSGFPRKNHAEEVRDGTALARVVEIGACFVSPGGEIHPPRSAVTRVPLADHPSVDAALRVSGITREEVAAARPIDEVADALQRWWATLGAPPVLAFPNTFEITMFEGENVLFPSWESCLMGVAARTLGRSGRVSLADACAAFGLPGGTHRAAPDALAEARLFCALVRGGRWPPACF